MLSGGRSRDVGERGFISLEFASLVVGESRGGFGHGFFNLHAVGRRLSLELHTAKDETRCGGQSDKDHALDLRSMDKPKPR